MNDWTKHDQYEGVRWITSSRRVKLFDIVTPFFNENVTAFPFEAGIGKTIVSRPIQNRNGAICLYSRQACFVTETFPSEGCAHAERFPQTECEHVPIIHFYATSPVTLVIDPPLENHDPVTIPLPGYVFFKGKHVPSPRRIVKEILTPKSIVTADHFTVQTPLGKRVYPAKVRCGFCIAFGTTSYPVWFGRLSPTLNRFDLIRLGADGQRFCDNSSSLTGHVVLARVEKMRDTMRELQT